MVDSPFKPSNAPGREGYAFGAPAYAWFVALVLAGLQFGSYMDRQVIVLVVEQMRRDLHVNDTGVSLLQGLAFALFYSVVAVPIGWAADRTQRRLIIMAGVLFWSLATLLCMVSRNYPMLFVARMMVGLGEAALIPAAYSMLSDYFPRAKLGGAMSSVTAASFLGSGLTLSLGGMVLARLPDAGHVVLPLVGPVFSWQLIFGFATIPSLILFLVMFFVREPPRRDVGPRTESASLGEIVAFIRANPAFWAGLLGGMCLLNVYQVGLNAWGMVFFTRTYGWAPQQIGVLYGAYLMIIGPLASVVGGVICDRLVAKGRRDANLIVPLGAALASLPVALAFALNGNGRVSAVLLGVVTFLAVVPFGAAIAAIPQLAPNRMRARLLAVYMLCTTLIGMTAGPWVIAVMTDYVFKDPQAIRFSVASHAALVVGGAVLCLALGLIGMRRASGPASSPLSSIGSSQS